MTEIQELCPYCGEYIPEKFSFYCGGNRLLHWVEEV